MPNFNLPMPNLPTPKATSGGADMGAIKLQIGQMYSARLETLSQIGRSAPTAQLKISVGQQTISQPLPQLPPQLAQQAKLGQNLQITITLDKSGKPVINLFPADTGKTQASAPQLMKVSLTDAQLVNLLSLNKNYQAKPDGSVQTQAQIVLQGADKTPTLKLPGLPSTIKLPEGLASLLKDAKTAPVSISVKNNKIEMQLTLPGKSGASAKFQLPFSGDKVATIVRQQITKAGDMPVQLDAKAAKPSQITLPNQQTLQLPAKASAQSEAKVTQLTQRQLTVSLAPQTSAQAGSKPLLSIPIDKVPLNQSLASAVKQTLTTVTDKAIQAQGTRVQAQGTQAQGTQAQVKSAEGQKLSLHTLLPAAKLNQDKLLATEQLKTTQLQDKAAPTGDAATTDKAAMAKQISQSSPLMIPDAPKAMENFEQQKQLLNKLIDPLVRLLLPKKMSWNEGLKNLD